MRLLVARTIAALLTVTSASAQDLEPRAYSPAPVGATFVVITTTRSTGGVFTDPSVLIKNTDAELGTLSLGLGRTLGIAGKQVQVFAVVPIVWGEASGDIGEDRRTAFRRGPGDARFRASVILAGSPAQRPAEFLRGRRRTVFGASVTVVPPVGQYDSTKLINLGSNRWAFKPEAAVSYPAGRWTLDGYAAVWFFTSNDTFYPGTSTRDQNPIFSLQMHGSYALPRRSWVALGATWYQGGRTTVDQVAKADLQKNARLGVTLAVPITAHQSVKAHYSRGATTRIGADFRTFGLAWQMVWF